MTVIDWGRRKAFDERIVAHETVEVPVIGMVERAARAADPKLWERIDVDFATNPHRRHAAEFAKKHALERMARAIASMRNPTDEMLCAVDPSFTTLDTWQAMIDEALS